MPEVYSAAYGTLYHKEPLKSFEKRVGHSPGFGLPSAAIFPSLCRKRRKTIVSHPTALVRGHSEICVNNRHHVKFCYLKFHPLKAVSRYRVPQLQVGED